MTSSSPPTCATAAIAAPSCTALPLAPPSSVSPTSISISNGSRAYVYKTPRGKSIVAHVPAHTSYDGFLGALLEKAAAVDQLSSRRRVTGSWGSAFALNCRVRPLDGTQFEPSGKKQRLLSSSNKKNSRSDESPTAPLASCRTLRNYSEMAYIVHNGKILDRSSYNTLTCGTATTNNTTFDISLQLRIRGGIDRQNRVGSKFGGGGVSSGQQSERERKDRLRELALETVDLAKDPYLMRNHLGTYECKLCLTLHTNEANYLAHTQGKKHQAGLAKRAMMEKKAKGLRSTICPVVPDGSSSGSTLARKRIKIGRPGYTVSKSRHWETNQRCLSFTLHFPEIDRNVQPRHRFMSAYEQKVESPPDRRYQYLLVAAEPYETVGFKVPNEPLDRKEGMFVSHWDGEEKTLTLTLYFVDPKEEGEMNEGDLVV